MVGAIPDITSVTMPSKVDRGGETQGTRTFAEAGLTLQKRLNGELGRNIVRQAKVMLQDPPAPNFVSLYGRRSWDGYGFACKWTTAI